MSAENWLQRIQNAKKTCIVENNLKKVHFLFDDRTEMVEEYNMQTDCLTRRAWRIKNELGGEGNWTVEIGDPEPSMMLNDNNLIKESSSTPVVLRRVTKRNLEWRINNLPYPLDVYSVTIEPKEKCLIIKTTNKKYYKKLNIPDLERCGLLPEQKNVEFTHKFNTLIITYKKPNELLTLEKSILNEIKSLQPRRDGDMDCKPS